MSAEDRAARAAARRHLATVRKTRLHRVEDDLDPIDGEGAITLLTALSRESWSATGAPLPTYARHEIPVRFVPRR
ncbi:hypothetical protein AKJ09_02639 [Labilithrix luteola]|uniref:Uncharacterized protein n=1 Tax=Labilithrix luteola TaxID=1391654 RepID=A0A0K1PR08_9BACT|nr:hypothetical protein AKJ09_02639 [Labilithrix luteola]